MKTMLQKTKHFIKESIFGPGRRPMKIRLGLYRGLTLWLDPAKELMFYLGLYEAETSKWLSSKGKKIKSLVDVGAGCGELSMWALKHPQVEQVLAYDGSHERWSVFEKNCRDNGFSLDSRLETVKGLFFGLEESHKEFQALKKLPDPILVKIDVDGGELSILHRMKPVLSLRKFFLLIETHSRELDESCFKLLEGMGYQCTRIPQGWWRILVPEQRPTDFNQWIVAVPAEIK